MRNPAKRRRLATGVASLLCLAALAAVLFFGRGWFGYEPEGEITFWGGLTLCGLGAVGLMLLSAWIERRSAAPISPFWLRLKPSFWGAVILTPITMFTIGVLLAPFGLGLFMIFSVLFGGPAFLLIGAPLAWAALKRGRMGLRWGLLLGFIGNILAIPLTALYFALLGGPGEDLIETVLSLHSFGAVFGPLYGMVLAALFDALYGRTRRKLLGPPAPRQRPQDRIARAEAAAAITV